ncbi:MAG: AbrB/MazE/SpoVT family DNA-binding domain-containing protein [Lentisphaeria bacterium]|nr:AbrB/MazE/SpoVT family DNA-binding domain-containing protein [Lentisphaeria bacterium]
METAKIFKTGRSQAVRLPKRYRFSGAEVAIRKEGDEVILSPLSRKGALEAFLALPCCPDFTVERESAQQTQERKLF